LLQLLQKRSVTGLPFRIVRRQMHQRADAPYPVGLLRARSERPCRRTAEQRNTLAAVHLVTSIGRHVGGGAIRATKQDIGQRAIRTPPIAVRIVEIPRLQGTCFV
jgi:hypothetical protein